MADVSGPLAADGIIIRPASVASFDLESNGYLEQEFLVSGTACAYGVAGDSGSDGQWAAAVVGTAPFRTRVVVRRPQEPGRFSGTLLVEWLNVSSGFEADPDWTYLHDEIFREGHAHAGVSAQALGVMGGEGLLSFPGPPNPGLRGSNPDRYGTLEHPGDEYAFDIYEQVGRSLGGGTAALGGLRPARVLAIGESQSAFYLTSYINAVHPLSRFFDGFLVHSRGAAAAPLAGTGIAGDAATEGVCIRADNQTPVLVLESESDLLAPLTFGLARQPDSDYLRIWEVAGTAHGDAYLIGAAATLLGFDWRINEGPHRFVAQAALHALNRWVGDGTQPPSAVGIELAAQLPPVIARDQAGIALGGVRTPAVDVPVAVLSGDGPPGARGPAWLVGSTTPFESPELVRRYGSKAGYLQTYSQALDACISRGFLLPAHRAELLAEADAVAFPAV